MRPDRAFIDHSLGALRDNLAFLAEMADRPESAFLSSREAHYSASHALMLSIEAMAGAADHVIAANGETRSKSTSHSLELLHRLGVLPSRDLVEKLSMVIRVRDLIVHRYGKMDYRLVYESLSEHLVIFEEYAVHIEAYLTSKGV